MGYIRVVQLLKGQGLHAIPVTGPGLDTEWVPQDFSHMESTTLQQLMWAVQGLPPPCDYCAGSVNTPPCHCVDSSLTRPLFPVLLCPRDPQPPQQQELYGEQQLGKSLQTMLISCRLGVAHTPPNGKPWAM